MRILFLQTAIIADRADIVEYLIGQGADINSPICGRPLHLAARLGLSEVLKVLLRLGADPNVTSAVCYPNSHHTDHLVYDPRTKEWGTTCPHDVQKTDLPTSACYSGSSAIRERSERISTPKEGYFNYPLHYAIKGDNVECVELLQEHGSGFDSCELHTAVYFGAHECTKYLIDALPQAINSLDLNGCVPLHYSLGHGKALVQLLVQNGAHLTCKTQYQETLLHLLFADQVKICGMSDVCVYLLDCGLKMTINALDKEGNSALHACLQRVHRNPPQSISEWEELEQCVQLLLDSKANPNISNRKGNTPLHILLDIFHSAEEGLPNLTPKFELKVDAVERLLLMLLANNANPNIPNKLSSPASVPLDTPLMMFIHNLFYKGYSGCIYHAAKTLQPAERLPFMDKFREMTCKVIHLLTQSAGGIQHVRSYGQLEKHHRPSCPIKLLLNHLDYVKAYGQDMLTDEVPVSLDYLTAMLAYLQSLLQAGFCPDECDDSCQVLETFSKLWDQKLVPFSILRDFLLLLIQHGANPNGCHYIMYDGVASPDVDSFPLVRLLHPNVESLYTKEEIRVLVHIFLSCMDRDILKQCLKYYFRRHRQTGTTLDTLVTDFYSAPLRLKTVCARTIRSSICRKLDPQVHNLPLPKEIKDYLLHLQY